MNQNQPMTLSLGLDGTNVAIRIGPFTAKLSPDDAVNFATGVLTTAQTARQVFQAMQSEQMQRAMQAQQPMAPPDAQPTIAQAATAAALADIGAGTAQQAGLPDTAPSEAEPPAA